MTCLKRHALKLKAWKVGGKKKRPTKAKQNFKIPGEKKDPKTFQEKEKKKSMLYTKN